MYRTLDGTPPMKPAISTVCSLNASLETILEDYSAGQCRLIEVWLGHAEQYLDGKPAQALSELPSSSWLRSRCGYVSGRVVNEPGRCASRALGAF